MIFNPSNSPWQPGQKALCVRKNLWRDESGEISSEAGPIAGTIYLVEAVSLATSDSTQVFLALSSFAGWWDGEEFRRVGGEESGSEGCEESEKNGGKVGVLS